MGDSRGKKGVLAWFEEHAILIVLAVLTVAWLSTGGVYLTYWVGWDNIRLAEFNAVGDFLAGFFSPLAFAWFVGALVLQSKELALQREELANNRKVLDEQSKSMIVTAQSALTQTNISLFLEVVSRSRDISRAILEDKINFYSYHHDIKNDTQRLQELYISNKNSIISDACNYIKNKERSYINMINGSQAFILLFEVFLDKIKDDKSLQEIISSHPSRRLYKIMSGSRLKERD